MNLKDEGQTSNIRNGDDQNNLTHLTTEIVASYVTKNPVAPSDLPSLIRNVHQALSETGSEKTSEPEKQLKPVVPIKRSIHPDYIICLEDGRKLQMLKRHLRTQYNMTPDEYRAKWNLPRDYPMVAPNYSAKRSSFAKSIGLGTATTKTSTRQK